VNTISKERIAEIAVGLGAPLAALVLYLTARGAIQSLREPPRVVVADALPASSAPFDFTLDAVTQDGRVVPRSPAGFVVHRRPLHLTGWATDRAPATAFTGITAYIDGRRIEEATYGQSRPDVAAHFQQDSLTDVGWSADVPAADLTPGRATVHVNFVGPQRDHISPGPPIPIVVLK
jgi:hypothetical protein